MPDLLHKNCQLTLSGVSAQNASEAALSPRNLAGERIDFILSSRSPGRSSSLSRFSYKRLPNTSKLWVPIVVL